MPTLRRPLRKPSTIPQRDTTYMQPKHPKPRGLQWAYGVTTVPRRLPDLLPRTLESLKLAGFDKPHLFIDDIDDDYERKREDFKQFGLPLAVRSPPVRAFGNWVMGLLELYLRYPNYRYYAMFQDDLVCCRNLRQYLDRCIYPVRGENNGYWNLFTWPINQDLCPKGYTGFYKSSFSNIDRNYQTGKGALALVFSHEAVTKLMSHSHMINRPQDANKGHQGIDGGIVTAMNKCGYWEYVHNPSLVQHTGKFTSVIGKKTHPLAPSFRGEDFDALELLG